MTVTLRIPFEPAHAMLYARAAHPGRPLRSLRIDRPPEKNRLPRYFTNAASMTPFCCLCLPSLMRKLAVKERGVQQRLSVSSVKLVPYLNDDTKYDNDLVNWVHQVVYTRAFEAPGGDLRIVPMGDVSSVSLPWDARDSRRFCSVCPL